MNRTGYELFVRGLPWTVYRRELIQYCSQFGQVKHCHVAMDKETGMHKGWGFVTFDKKVDVTNLTNKNIHFLGGNFLHFDVRTKAERLAMGVARNKQR